MGKETGGPAFPSEQGHTPDGTWNQTYEPGMTLRDWFAGQAMAGLSTAFDRMDGPYEGCIGGAASAAYAMADAMLKERAK